MKKKVLLVEYDNPTIEKIREILSSPVFDISIADEGEMAKDLLKNNSFDLVITAAMLPKFHGFNLSQYIGNIAPNTKIIIISGIYKGIEYKHQAMTQYKADDFFEKPLNEPEFKKRVLEFLNLTEEDLDESPKGPSTNVPITDTTKMPAMKKVDKEEANKLSSEELFGDIIEKVEKIPSYEIKIDEEQKKESQTKGDVTKEKEEPEIRVDEKEDKEESPEKKEVKKMKKPISESEVQKKIDQELENIIKTEKPERDEKKFKKIEDDISKKLEDTLSGLGISSKPKKSEKKPVEPTVEPPAEKEKREEPPAKKVSKGKQDELGDYDILGLIARGGMAEIYKAKRKGVKGFEKIIAIKKILSGYGEDDRYIEMFVDEAKIAAELTHPNIVQIYDLGKKDDYYFIAMEYIQGRDLRLILRKLKEQDKTIPEEISLALIIKILEALSYAHSAKDNQGKNLDIVHRDISPPNILLSYNGDVKLTDFGVSKASNKIHQTISGALKGKLLYMSPEQAKGDRNIDHRSDLYSVGVVLFEIITGEKLFLDSSEVRVLKKVQESTIIKPSEVIEDIDPELETIILKALHKERESRYQNASELIRDIESYLDKKFDHIPNPIHLSHFVYNLFAEEIKKENIKVDLKSIPYEIKKRPPDVEIVEAESLITEKIPSEKKEETESDEILELKVESIEEEKIEPVQKETDAKKEKKPSEEKGEYQPVIEIDFDKPKSVPDESKIPSSGPQEPLEIISTDDKKMARSPLIDSDFQKRKKEARKKPSTFLLIIFFVVVAVAIVYYIFNLSSTTSNDQPIEKSTILKTTDPEKKEPETNQEEIPDMIVSPESGSTADNNEINTATTDTQQLKNINTEPPADITVKEEIKTKQPSLNTTQKKFPEQIKQKKPAVTKKPEKKTIKKEEPKAEEIKQPEQTPESSEPEIEPIKEPEKEIEQPPIPKIKEGQILPTSDVDTKPIPVSTPLPKINRKIRKTITTSQNLLVSILIDHNGNIEKVKLIKKSNHMEINSLIISTIAKWKYKPAKKNNVKVKIWKSIPITIKK